jgi:rhodanese-related sulfurtransferase
MLKKLIIAIMITAFAMTAVAAEENSIAANMKKFVKHQKEIAPKIDAKTLKSWMEEKKDFLLLDVRTAKEVGAINIYAEKIATFPRGVVEFYFTKKHKDPNQTIVVYCKAGARGAIVTNRLKELGYNNVLNLVGGIKGWMKAGYEVENFMGTFKEVQF